MFDRMARYLLRTYAVGLLGWLLGLGPRGYRFLGWLDTRVGPAAAAERTADTVADLVSEPDGLPRMVFVEFQTSPDEEMFGRALQYLGGGWRLLKPNALPGDRYFVGAVLVNLRGRGTASRRYVWEEAGLEVTLKAREVNLIDLDAAAVLEDIASGAAPAAVLAWIPLMKNGGEPGTIDRWLEVAGRLTDRRLRADVGLAASFADAAGCGPAWKDALKEWNVDESPWLNEYTQKAVARATEKGVGKGQAASVVAVLEARFRSVPPAIAEPVLREESLDKLRQWLGLAATTDSLDAFRRDAGL